MLLRANTYVNAEGADVAGLWEKGMLDWIRADGQNTDEVLAKIETAWP